MEKYSSTSYVKQFTLASEILSSGFTRQRITLHSRELSFFFRGLTNFDMLHKTILPVNPHRTSIPFRMSCITMFLFSRGAHSSRVDEGA